MSMTQALDDICYERRHFNYDSREERHPLWVTDKHFLYPLQKDEKNGRLLVKCDARGQPYRCPRSLAGICAYQMINDGFVSRYLNDSSLPADLYRPLLSEAIYQREATAIIRLVANWPMTYLRIYDVIPLEDYLEDDYLTLKFDSSENTSVIDCIITGLLKLQPCNKLRFVDFSNFDKDRRLCRELCRLPILWMKPADRKVENIHEMLNQVLDISKDKVQKYLNKINFVYANMDTEFKHGTEIDPLTIIAGMNISMVEDVPIGLVLQLHSPFRFACSRLWMHHIPEVTLPVGRLDSLLDITLITHIELEDHTVPLDENKVDTIVGALRCLRHLVALSLPNTVDLIANQTMASKMNGVLKRLDDLQRINLSYCNIRGHLRNLLHGTGHSLQYLNLRDCRLTYKDIAFLAGQYDLSQLRELNLSCNNLQDHKYSVKALLRRMPCLMCLSLSFCALSLQAQVQLVCQLQESNQLKVLCLQGYTPLPWNEAHDLLFYCSEIQSLQRLWLFPEAYAFPGDSDRERMENKAMMLRLGYRYLQGRHRPDIYIQ